MNVRVLSVLVLAGFLIPAASADQVVLTYGSVQSSVVPPVTSSKIAFDGAGNFSFADSSTGKDFAINETTGLPSTLGLQGNIDGIFTISNVTPFGPGGEKGTVKGNGTLRIADGFGKEFQANLQWVNIASIQTFTGLNIGATLNLSNFQYNGTNAGLLELASAPAGIITASISFASQTTLSSLLTAVKSNSYSGQITAVPEPLYSGLALVAGLVALVSLRRYRASRQMA